MPAHAYIFPALAASSAAGSWFGDNWGWMVAVLIVVLGLFVSGARDVARFSLGRAWAISSVCFAESIRKRVLWLAPVAIVGVIGIAQFQRALDEQDAVRQSLKICLFATGLVAILSSIILACTNLPKEIESRVIYTIVTKPITRLEVILGKVIGFSRVSLTIVAIMGVFTWGYMHFVAHEKSQQIAYRLQDGDISDTERARLSEYQRTGLLAARSFWAPDELSVYGSPPDPSSPYRVISNVGDQDCVAGFPANRGILFGAPADTAEHWAEQGVGQNGLVIRVVLNTNRTGEASDQPISKQLGPAFSAPTTLPAHLAPANITLEVLDQNFTSLFAPDALIGASSASELVQNIAGYVRTGKIDPQHSGGIIRLSEPMPIPGGGEGQYAYAWVPPRAASMLINHPQFQVRISGNSANVDYLVGPKPVSCFIPQFKPGGIDIEAPGATTIEPLPGASADSQSLVFRGRMGIHYDQEMNGGRDAPGASAVYTFHNAPALALDQRRIPFQFDAEIDRSNSEIEAGREDATKLAVAVIDEGTKKVTVLKEPMLIDSRLPTFFTVPAEAISGGDYDLVFHVENTAQTVGLVPTSLQLVTSQEFFELNLAKSLAIIWMMTILVISLAVLCSTFLSWPIAVVLTVMLLLGHWSVDQLSDASGPGLGPQLVTASGVSDPAMAHLVSTTVDSLSLALNYASRVLPDTSKFDAIEDIQQGVSISSQKLLEALGVLAGFAIPAIVLAYVTFRNKEVAP